MAEKLKKPKFKYTRELLRIAQQDGMTQQEMADVCRVQQSVVSNWLKGNGRAAEHQIAELKRRYGSRLNRTTSRVYIVRTGPISEARWEDTERAKRLLALERLKDDKVRSSPEFEALRRELCLLRSWSVTELIEEDRSVFEESRHPPGLVHVEGPIVFRHSFTRPVIEVRGRAAVLEHEPLIRWIIHHQARGRFVFVQQQHRELNGRQVAAWHEEVEDGARQGLRGSDSGLVARLTRQDDQAERWVECTDDAGRWLSVVKGPFDDRELLESCDAYLADAEAKHSPHDDATVGLLVRKMLVEQGYEVPGVVRIQSGG